MQATQLNQPLTPEEIAECKKTIKGGLSVEEREKMEYDVKLRYQIVSCRNIRRDVYKTFMEICDLKHYSQMIGLWDAFKILVQRERLKIPIPELPPVNPTNPDTMKSDSEFLVQMPLFYSGQFMRGIDRYYNFDKEMINKSLCRDDFYDPRIKAALLAFNEYYNYVLENRMETNG